MEGTHGTPERLWIEPDDLVELGSPEGVDEAAEETAGPSATEAPRLPRQAGVGARPGLALVAVVAAVVGFGGGLIAAPGHRARNSTVSVPSLTARVSAPNEPSSKRQAGGRHGHHRRRHELIRRRSRHLAEQVAASAPSTAAPPTASGVPSSIPSSSSSPESESSDPFGLGS